MNGLGVKFGEGAGDFCPHPIVGHGTLLPAVHKQDSHLQANRAQTLDLFLHKDTPTRELRGRVHIRDGQNAHGQGCELSSTSGFKVRHLADWLLESGRRTWAVAVPFVLADLLEA